MAASQTQGNRQASQPEGIPTMRGVASQQTPWDVDTETKFKCEDCGHYPLKNAVSKETPCPNCKSTGEKVVQNGTMKFSNIYFGNGAVTTTPKVTLVDVATNKVLEFEGEDVVLNRANLHPSDQSISSAQHVQFIKEKDTWHVTDLSTNNATFIQVTGKVAVETGAHILIGNRIFRIELE
ncbi:hypothetical protein AAE02nite_18520 [Adhaeribacter aerolatus]|uniref:FHA domain-containing protein n=1 Tax=Adhaeribacter aerolatus TaxID=670289 RepID=A0A512AWT7_9BACT|nr:hypothetical protein AAE02nite_18520 [Adhaeribacter aerolatus]